VRRAQIQVPDKMPASVAVLQVRNAPTSGSAPGKRRPATRVAARHVAGPVRAAPGTPPAALAGAPAAANRVTAATVPGLPAAAAPAQAAPERTIALDITLDAPQEVLVRGRGLDVELGGTIHISGTASRPDSSGSLNLKRGTLSVVGQTLTFTDGDIDFTGAPLTDPNLKLVATSTTNNIIATVTVSGSASDPKITLSSVPELPQDEILAQLLFHQGVGSLSAFQVAEIAAGLAELSGVTSGVGDPLASLRNALGLDRLTVGSGSTGNATLEAGRYIAPGVYLGAQQSATGSGTQASVQIDIAKGLKVVTTAGTGSSSATGAASSGDAASVGLTYQFEY
jgi:translocation and assembly module TamB